MDVPALTHPARDRVLLVTGSPRGAASSSSELADALVESLRRERPETHLDHLDPFAELGPFAADAAAGKMAVIAGEPVPASAAAAWARVVEVTRRFAAAELLVFAVPMWNGGIPWALKLLVDTVTQPGLTFAFDPDQGYRGLLGGRRAVAIYTSRVFAPGVPPAFGVDFHSTYLSWWLRFCGIEEIHELRLQPTYPSPDFAGRREAALAQARRLGRELARPSRGSERTERAA